MEAERHAIAYVVRSFPRLSQTFILNEVLALERLGVRLEIFPIIDPSEPMTQPRVAQVRAPIRYLQRGSAGRRMHLLSDHLVMLRRRPRRYLTTLGYVLRRADLDDGYTSATRWACFDHAVRLSRHITRRPGAAPISHVHSHFAHDPTLVALLSRRLTGVTFSFTAHARDLYQTPLRCLSERIHESSAVITCCEANLPRLERAAAAGDLGKLRLIHHGVNSSDFGYDRRPGPPEGESPLIVSVGRLVEKKGFFELLDACARLRDAGQRFRCVIYGEGPIREALLERLSDLDLNCHVTLAGACTQDRLARELRLATAFALTPIVTADGDRDGIPNVLVEAMASGLAVVSTDVGGIAELVMHEATGLLSQPGDVAAIAHNLLLVLTDHALRIRLAAAGRQAVVNLFDARANALLLADVLGPKELTG